jgi:hypothetical protein
MEMMPLPLRVQASDTTSANPGSNTVSSNTSGGASTNATIGPSAPRNMTVKLISNPITNDLLGTHPVLIRDPLSEVTRRERKTFLGVSILSIAVIKANLIPSKIAAFGIEIDHVKHQELVTLLAAVVIYFLLVFIAYAYSDFLGWRIAFWEASRARAIEREKIEEAIAHGADDDSPEVAECYRRQLALSEKAIPTSAIRAFLDFLLPVFVGIAALMVLRGCA